MKPGRELDALVAEKIFGYVWRNVTPAGRKRTLDRPDRVSVLDWENGNVFYRGSAGREMLPRYSTDISSAWEVVEKMDVRWEGAFFQVTRTEAGYSASYLDPGYRPFQDTDVEVEAETAPLAICLCALKAVGVSEGSPPTP